MILGDGLEEIGEYAFSYCKSLVRIDIPPSVRVIEEGAFDECSELTTASLVRIDVPPNVRAIKDMAFRGCSGLTTVILGVGLEEIGRYAFVRCRSLV